MPFTLVLYRWPPSTTTPITASTIPDDMLEPPLSVSFPNLVTQPVYHALQTQRRKLKNYGGLSKASNRQNCLVHAAGQPWRPCLCWQTAVTDDRVIMHGEGLSNEIVAKSPRVIQRHIGNAGYYHISRQLNTHYCICRQCHWHWKRQTEGQSLRESQCTEQGIYREWTKNKKNALPLKNYRINLGKTDLNGAHKSGEFRVERKGQNISRLARDGNMLRNGTDTNHTERARYTKLISTHFHDCYWSLLNRYKARIWQDWREWTLPYNNMTNTIM